MIIQVKTKKNLENFYNFISTHYKNAKNYIHPLLLSLEATFDLYKNPFWKTVNYAFFIYQKNNEILGRIAVIISKNNPENANFGFFECIDDENIAKELFITAEGFARKFGSKNLSGPYNPSINYELGVLVDGFEREPFFMMSYNYDFYDNLIKKCGYEKQEDFFSYLLSPKDFIEHQKLLKVKHKIEGNPAIKLHNLDLKNIEKETKTMFDIYNDAFVHHFGFVAFEKEEFKFMSKDMLQIINPKFLKILYFDNEPVAFILALPNLNKILKKLKNGKLFPFGILQFLFMKNSIDEVRVINVAVKQKYQHLGLGAVLYYAIFEEMKKYKYKIGQLSWVAEDNQAMKKAIEQLGATKENTYRVYQKALL